MTAVILPELRDLVEQDILKVREEKGEEYANAFAEGITYLAGLYQWLLSLKNLKGKKEADA